METGEEYAEYCATLNSIVKELGTTRGRKSRNGTFKGTIYTYQNQKVRLIYQDSGCGNDHYQIFINHDFWNALPEDVNPMLIFNGGWNFVYHYQDGSGKKILHQNIPGTWLSLFFTPDRLSG